MPASSKFSQRLLDYSRIIAFLWAIEICDRIFFGGGLERYGIHPRNFSHWEGILFAPFLHGDWNHLIGNSLSLMVLGAAILVQGWRDVIKVSWVSALTAGLLVFAIGKSGTVHIGASSVVFGYFGYLVGAGIYQRTPSSIFFAVLVIIFYGGTVNTMFPTDQARAFNISWESHLGGAIGGFLVARNRKTSFKRPVQTFS